MRRLRIAPLLLLSLLPIGCGRKLPVAEVYRSGDRVVRVLDERILEISTGGEPVRAGYGVDGRVVRISTPDGKTLRFVLAEDGLEEEGGKILLSRTVRAKRSEPARRALAASMVKIPAGGFLMGVHGVEPDESPVHKVTLSAFEMSKTEVTQELYEAVLGVNPSARKGAKRPVESVSRKDAEAFLEELDALEGSGHYRLPTEAEWEYAARGESNETYWFGNEPEKLATAGWFTGNSGGAAHDVGTLAANRFGLFDVHGNVWEWCSDRYGSYPEAPVVDPKGPGDGNFGVRRGCGWGNDAKTCRAANRDAARLESRLDDVGFRVARSLPPAK